MHVYRIYDLIVESAIVLPELVTSDGPGDVRLESTNFSLEEAYRRHNGASSIGSGIEGLLNFQVQNGNLIRVSIDPEADLAQVRTAILGSVFSTLQRQRGNIVLHACAVAKGDRALAFVGGSGWGKSTLAEFCCQNGYTLLNDDVLVIRPENEGYVAIPGYPQVRLRPEAGNWLREDFTALDVLAGGAEKRISTHSQTFSHEPRRLEKLFILEASPADELHAEPLKIQTAIAELIGHSRVSNIFTDRRYQADYMRLCSRLIQSVPILRLKRRKNLGDLPRILDLVESDNALLEERA